MSKNRKLTDLKNIGARIAGRLNEAGIYSEDELRRAAPAEPTAASRPAIPTKPSRCVITCIHLKVH